MGAWDAGPFGNDHALDWVAELEASGGAEMLYTAFTAVNDGQYRGARDCASALAAAEIVASLLGNPTDYLPEEVESWVESFESRIQPSLVQSARQAVNGVLVSSELRELWAETAYFVEWQSLARDLLQRLAG